MTSETERTEIHVDIRRLRVASLYLRGLSPREITVALPKNGVSDPQGQPYSLEDVCYDIEFLEQLWSTEIKAKKKHKVRIWAMLREAQRAAWAQGDLDGLLKALDDEAELLKLDVLLD